MKYIVKQSEYKPLEGKEIALQPVEGTKVTLDDIWVLLQRVIKLNKMKH